MKLVMWCEFPKQVNWRKAEKIITFPLDIYVAVQSKRELQEWRKKTKFNLKPWVLLPKKKGYWFSGFTNKEDIDVLKEFKGLPVKIDLEPPLPSWKYKNRYWFAHAFKQFFKKAPNNEYLEKIIKELEEAAHCEEVLNQIHLIVNEFPAMRWYLKRQGIYFESKKGTTKNIMCYSSFAGPLLRPLVKKYLYYYIKKNLKENKETMFSLGLIGTGILEQEHVYPSTKELEQDLLMLKKAGGKKVALYSLEGLLKRESPQEWVEVIKKYL